MEIGHIMYLIGLGWVPVPILPRFEGSANAAKHRCRESVGIGSPGSLYLLHDSFVDSSLVPNIQIAHQIDVLLDELVHLDENFPPGNSDVLSMLRVFLSQNLR
jgi:hypothetical protein